MKSPDRFDLEQQLLDCWRITDDLKTVLKITEAEDIDRTQNALIGLREIYEQKFNDLWDTFETLVQDKKIT
jgi:hypothetical protein